MKGTALDMNAVKQQVMSYKNGAVTLKYAREQNLPLDVAEMHFQELLKFLFLCGTSEESFSPSLILDEVWHTFILFTKDYDDFCHSHFGTKIHHRPDAEVTKSSRSKNNTQYRNLFLNAEMHFGELATDVWPVPASLQKIAVCEDGCTSNCGGNGSCGNQQIPKQSILTMAANCNGDCGKCSSCGGSTNCQN